uniref:C-type lectin domain-containing protein n=1 Tax=Myripristis murdjan TaxID=586833 RepID=A0A667YUP9_9TELE
MQTKKQLQMMTAKHDALKRNLTGEPVKCHFLKGGTCFKCDPDWEPHRNKCYRFLTEKLNWDQSRSRCEKLGGQLVKIDSKDEQVRVALFSTQQNKFWIGLTDQETEDEWLWVDGSRLDKRFDSFWSGKEPDNWKGTNSDGEDCATMGEKGGAAGLKSWFDRDCNKLQKSICEKSASTGRVKFNCE